ncbi:MAG: YkgJ family cysteine cluster protein [Streptococcaceae bacterium]|nr:YkgJ family cysteine cluster protein [Streptococcaceae bacterium]
MKAMTKKYATDFIDIEHYRDLAKQKQKENTKFLIALKKKPPKQLDKIALEIHQEVFSEIDCTKCANCCKTLGPLWTEADIERVAKFLRMKVGDFEKAYLRVDEDGDKVFQTMPCPFLGSDDLCTIYEVRPKACREFPHTDRKKIYQINHLTLKNAEYCPAVYEFIEKLKTRQK